MDSEVKGQAVQDHSSGLSNRKTQLIITGALVLLIVLITATVLISGIGSSEKKSPKKTQGSTSIPNSLSRTLSPQEEEIVRSFPAVSVSSWKVPSKLVKPAPPTASVHALKQNYTRADFTPLASKFIKNPTIAEDATSFTATTGPGSNSILYFVKNTATFLYKSKEGLPLTNSTREIEKLNTFVRSIYPDETLQVISRYERKDAKGVVYYEAHRDWDKVGLPIYSFYGFMNLPEKEAFGTISLTKQQTNLPNDPNIIRVANGGYNGKIRADDFNTMTIGVSNNKVVSVISNIRPRVRTESSTSPLITYASAVQKLQRGEYEKILTVPSGQGTVDLDKFYPQNKAELKDVTISEAQLAYLENPPTVVQEKLIPYYVFRGAGTMTSGYRVNLFAAVPATNKQVLGASTERILAQAQPTNVPLQMGTIKFISPTVPVPTVFPTCPNTAPQSYTAVQTGKEGVIVGQNGGSFYNIAGLPATQSATLIPTFNPLDPTAFLNCIDLSKIDYSKINFVGSGMFGGWLSQSPTLFVYSNQSKNLEISLPQNVTYSDPGLNTDRWNISVDADGITANNAVRPYLYYEYKDATFNKPLKGWLISKGKVNELVDQIAAKLALTVVEKERLSYEINFASHNVNAEELFVGLIPQKEIENKLPLKIDQKPDTVYRYHFFVSDEKSNKFIEPDLKPIERKPFMLLELGASSAK